MSQEPRTYDRKEIVKLWMQAFKDDRSSKWVAGQLGIDPMLLSSRVHYLRNMGVSLPSLRRNQYDGDLAEMKKIVADAMKEKGLA